MLTRMVSISWPCDPPASASQSAGITGVSHHTRPNVFFWEVSVHILRPLFDGVVFVLYIRLSFLYIMDITLFDGVVFVLYIRLSFLYIMDIRPLSEW